MLSRDAFTPWVSSDPLLADTDMLPHPTEVCEPVNLAAAEQPPLRTKLVSNPAGLSTMQLETVRRVMQSFEQRGAFLLGDATGVGKSRTIAGVILESAARDDTLKVAWVSASTRLESEARSEMEIVGTNADRLLFESYSGLQVSGRETRLREWLQGGAALLVLDECHLLRNEKSIAAQVTEDLLRQLPKSTVLYSSATACSHVRHMSYLGRLGLFGTNESPFPTFDALACAVRRHGPPLMELLAIDMRSRGAYVARQLSFASLEVVHHRFNLKHAQRLVYDQCAARFRDTPRHGSKQQSFFQRLITGFKVDEVIRLTEGEVAKGNSVVVSLVNTGEAASRRVRALSEEACTTPLRIDEEAEDLHDIPLPINPLDALVQHFGDRMVELSGRTQRLVPRNGRMQMEANPPLREQVSLFTSGARHVAVLSRAGGTGISLHDAKDGRRRVHIILEIPWSAEDLLQQMGRTHRSDSQRPPKYILVSTDVSAEARFAFSIVQKLQSFGALVKADRNSCTFSFLHVPRWSAADKRSISLYFAMAAAIDGNDAIPAISRQQALSACSITKRAGDATIKTRVTHMLRRHRELGDVKASIVASGLRLYPNDTTMLVERWNIGNHRLFPYAFKEQVMSLLLCSRAFATSRTLGILSKDVLFYIIEWLACPITLDRAKVAAETLRASGLEDLPAMTMDHILNRVLGVEMAIQDDVFRVADALVHPERKARSADLLQYATERAGSCVSASIKDIALRRFDAIDGIRVEVVYDVHKAREAPSAAHFLRHASGNRLAWFHAGRLVFNDGAEMRLDDETQMRARDFYPSNRAEWNQAVERVHIAARHRVRRLPTCFDLATRDALQLWETSSKRILRVPPTDHFPQGVIGLLVHRGGK